MKLPLRSALVAIFALLSLPLLAAKPNIIFVLTDDLGYGDLGVFHQNSRDNGAGGGIAGDGLINGTEAPHIHTPHLDTLAREGAMMTRHYSSAPVCAPARGSLLLGRDQGHANVRDNSFDKALANNHTLGTVLKSAGYSTAVIGKWGVQGSPQYTAAAEAFPTKRGFDFFFGYLDHGAGHRHYPKEDNSGGNPLVIWENNANVTNNLDKCYSTDLFTARAKKWIVDQTTSSPETPFFLYLTYTAPHAALQVATQEYPSFSGANDSLTGGMQWTGTPHNMISTASGTVNSYIHPQFSAFPANGATARHGSMIRRIDDGVGDIKQLLKDLEIDDNTIIIFTSDNGPHHEASSEVVGSGAAPAQDPRNFQSYGNMDGTKRDHWEAGIRVPTIAWWPGKIDNNDDNTPINSTRPSAFHDWMATFIDAAGATPPSFSNGVSLLPELTGSGTQLDKGYLYFEYRAGGFNNTQSYADFAPSHRGQTRNEMQTIFLDDPMDDIRYKGVRYNVSNHSQDFRIYDVDADPGETNDLASARPALQQQMKDKVLQVRIDGDYARGYMNGQNAAPAAPAGTENGLSFKAYTGTWPWVPETAYLSPIASGESTGFDLSKRTQNDHIALEFTGFIEVPAAGEYTFRMTADSSVSTNASGAMLWIHDAHIIDDDFNHNGSAKTGKMRLAAGNHPIRVLYKHATGSHDLNLQYSGPGIPLQTVPESALFREAIPDPEPIANPDTASTTGSASISIAVLANDTDDGLPQPLAIQSLGSPTLGSAVINGQNIDYTPSAGKYGTDIFSYTITDGEFTASSTVTVEIFPETTTYWLPLDETGGTIAHDALGKPVGVLENFPAAPWTAGKLGNSLEFNGTNSRVTLTGYKGVTGTAARTVVFWLNANASQNANTRPTMVSWGASNSSDSSVTGRRFDINLNHTAGFKLRAEFNSSGIDFTTPNRNDLRGAGWVHCAIVVPEGATVSQVAAYIDGVAATGSATAGNTAVNSADTNIVTLGSMADGSANRTLAGKLDDVRIYPRALSAAEIAALASQDSNGNAQSQWYFRYSGNALPGTAEWTADTDGDGYNNRLEYALGGNPTSADTNIAPRLEGLEQFTFNRRQVGIFPAAYVPETSIDLVDWEPLGSPTAVPHPELSGFDSVTVPLPISSDPSRFVRLRVDP